MKKKIKIYLLIAVVIVIAGLAYAYSVYNDIFKSNIIGDTYIYIPTNADYDEVIDSLVASKVILDISAFKKTAKLKKYGSNIHPGRYKFEKGMSNSTMINILRSGKQSPVKVTFNNARSVYDMASKVQKFIEADSLSIVELLQDESYINELGFNSKNIIGMFIPNTYEFYWNTGADGFIKKMKNEYEHFWNEERTEKAKEINLTPKEVSVLASIVQAEQRLHNDEKAIIAGLYINRLNRNMLLQSDPTLIFASGDYTKKRVLNRDKEIDSPYNTYMHLGLPPGPINMPEISSINAVLNYKKHNYIFMCAKEDFSGYHNFSTNSRQHEIYAQRWRRALNKKKIWK